LHSCSDFFFAIHKTHHVFSVISGFRRDVDEICSLLGYYAMSNGNPLLTFRDNVSVPSSMVKKSNKEGASLTSSPF
jgi:hypothetical protein